MPTYKFKLLTQGDLFTYTTDARTFGDFKQEISNSPDLRTKFGVSSESDLSELHLIERSTKTSYIVDNAVMPTGNALFFVSLTKSKGGLFGESFFSRDMSYEDLVELAEYLNDTYDADIEYPEDMSYDELYTEIDRFYDAQNQEEEEEPKTVDISNMSVKEKLEVLADILLDISIQMEDGEVDITGICIDGVTFEELEKETEEIYNKLFSLGLIK